MPLPIRFNNPLRRVSGLTINERRKNMETVSDYVVKQVVQYFGTDKWLYICHPKLNYQSPYRYLQNGGDITNLLDTLSEDINF